MGYALLPSTLASETLHPLPKFADLDISGGCGGWKFTAWVEGSLTLKFQRSHWKTAGAAHGSPPLPHAGGHRPPPLWVWMAASIADK